MLPGAMTQSSMMCPVTRRARPVRSGLLLDGANIYWDLRSMSYAEVTLTGNRTLYARHVTKSMKSATFILEVTQDGSGSHTLTFDSTIFKFPGGTPPTLSTGAGAIDILTFVSDGTYMYGVCQKAFA